MKRIICLTMALVMTFACVSAFAAQYDGLPEKMMLQMELSGLKGSVTLSATGNPELEALLNGLSRIRPWKSGASAPLDRRSTRPISSAVKPRWD